MADAKPVVYVKDGRPNRHVYTPVDRVQAEWDGFKPASPKDERAAEKLTSDGTDLPGSTPEKPAGRN